MNILLALLVYCLVEVPFSVSKTTVCFCAFFQLHSRKWRQTSPSVNPRALLRSPALALLLFTIEVGAMAKSVLGGVQDAFPFYFPPENHLQPLFICSSWGDLSGGWGGDSDALLVIVPLTPRVLSVCQFISGDEAGHMTASARPTRAALNEPVCKGQKNTLVVYFTLSCSVLRLLHVQRADLFIALSNTLYICKNQAPFSRDHRL